MTETDLDQQLPEVLASVFQPVLSTMGFRLAGAIDQGVRFESDRIRLEARYVPRDGDLAVYVIPVETGERLSLVLYLRAIGSETATRLGEAVAESPDDAVRLGRMVADGLQDAKKLLAGDPAELARARGLRWWNVTSDNHAG